LFKYVYKGHDCAHVSVTLTGLPPPDVDESAAADPAAAARSLRADEAMRLHPERYRDEVIEYLTGRYVGSSESCWRTYAFELHNRGAAVERLPIHLPGQVPVEFDETDDLQAVADAGCPGSKLTAWFDLNARMLAAQEILNAADPSSACPPETASILYQDIPSHYTWHGRAGGAGTWQKRRNRLTFPTVGRMLYVSRNQVNIVVAFELMHACN
jgi:hypothetical protein